jgi:TRAP-type C4-dicarboxylate transport system substrate-binding protein
VGRCSGSGLGSAEAAGHAKPEGPVVFKVCFQGLDAEIGQWYVCLRAGRATTTYPGTAFREGSRMSELAMRCWCLIGLFRPKRLTLAWLATLVLVAGCGGSVAGPGATTSRTYTIAFGSALATSDPNYLAEAKFAATVGTASHNRLKVLVYPNNQLGSTLAVFQATESGAIQMDSNNPSTASAVVPDLSVISLPFLFGTEAQAVKAIALNGSLFQYYNNELTQKAGVRILGWTNGGLYQLITEKPINSVSDLKGLKMRTIPDKYVQQAATLMGIVPVTSDFATVLTDMHTGLINAEVLPPATIVSSQQWQAATYVTILDFSYASQMIWINNAFYQSLPGDLQKILTSAGAQLTQDANAGVATSEQSAYATIKANGMTVSTFPASERASLVTRVQAPLYATFKANLGSTALDMALAP